MNFLRKSISLLLIVLMIISLAACGHKSSGSTPSDSAPSASSAANADDRTFFYTGDKIEKGSLYMRLADEDEIVTSSGGNTPVLQYIDRELIALAAVGTDKAEMAALFDRYELDVVGYNDLCGGYQLRTRSPVTEKELLALRDRIVGEAAVVDAFLNALFELDADEYPLPDDPWDDEPVSAETIGGANWGVEAVRAPWFWQNYDLRGVRVGVIDNMFAENHTDLDFAEVFHNGYKTKDDYWYHGTHVAGIIGARYDNGKGICGVLKDPLLYATDWDAGEFSTQYKNYSTLFGFQLKIGVMLKNGARVINFSIGYNRDTFFEYGFTADDIRRFVISQAESMTQYLNAYLERGWDFVLVKSAGNNGIDAFDNWWATAITDEAVKSRIVVVGAAGMNSEADVPVDSSAAGTSGAGSGSFIYAKMDRSNDGPRVDVVAPGCEIFSCIQDEHGRSVYEPHSGTSMAAPFVTAACAALWAYYPSLSGADIKTLLIETADIPVSGFDAKMIDLQAAFGGFAEGELDRHAQMSLQEILEAYRRSPGNLPDGVYRAVLYAVGHAGSPHVSSEVLLEDYMCFSREEIAALKVGDTLKMSRFVPIEMVVLSHVFGEYSDGYEDVLVESMGFGEVGFFPSDILYINHGEVVLENRGDCWRVMTINGYNAYYAMQFLQSVTLSFAPDVRIRDFYSPYLAGFGDGSEYCEWTDPYDFFEFNPDYRCYEAVITVENDVITEITIPCRY